jgi:hypothetical protein
MQHLVSRTQPKQLRRIAAWLLLGWLLALGVAIAAPLMATAPDADVCSVNKPGQAASRHGQLDCAQCLPADAPPPKPTCHAPVCTDGAAPPQVTATARASAQPAWQPPPRGPPRF